MITTVRGRKLDIGWRRINSDKLDGCMAKDSAPIGASVLVGSNARIVVLSESAMRADQFGDNGAVVSSQEFAPNLEQILAVRDAWAIDSATMASGTL